MKCKKNKQGSGLLSTIASVPGAILNRTIDALPVELHIPGYQYCGPGTKLATRLARGDPGINKLDAACKQHDIAYATFSDSTNRAQADKVLAERAWQRVKSPNASLGEKATAWAVTNLMKLKSKFGGGMKRKNRRTKKRNGGGGGGGRGKNKSGRGLYIRPFIKQGGGGGRIKKNSKNRQRRRRQQRQRR